MTQLTTKGNRLSQLGILLLIISHICGTPLFINLASARSYKGAKRQSIRCAGFMWWRKMWKEKGKGTNRETVNLFYRSLGSSSLFFVFFLLSVPTDGR